MTWATRTISRANMASALLLRVAQVAGLVLIVLASLAPQTFAANQNDKLRAARDLMAALSDPEVLEAIDYTPLRNLFRENLTKAFPEAKPAALDEVANEFQRRLESDVKANMAASEEQILPLYVEAFSVDEMRRIAAYHRSSAKEKYDAAFDRIVSSIDDDRLSTCLGNVISLAPEGASKEAFAISLADTMTGACVAGGEGFVPKAKDAESLELAAQINRVQFPHATYSYLMNMMLGDSVVREERFQKFLADEDFMPLVMERAEANYEKWMAVLDILIANEMTKEELRTVATAIKSPAMRKFSEKNPEILTKAKELNQQWLFSRAEAMMVEAILAAKAKGIDLGKPMKPPEK